MTEILELIGKIGLKLLDVGQDLQTLKAKLQAHPDFDSSATDQEWQETQDSLKE